MSDDLTAREDAFEDARRRWEQVTGRADDAVVGSGADNSIDVQYTANEYSTSIDPLDKAAYAQAYRDGGVRGWLRHAHAVGMAQHQQQLDAKREHAAMGRVRQPTTRGQRVIVVIVIAMLVFALGTLVKDQIEYMRGECVWASWEEYDHDDGYVTKLRCIDVDSPVL